MIPLSILSSISVSEKRYNVKLPIIYFLITQGTLLIVRIYNMYNPIEPIYHFEGLIHNLYTIEGIIVYVTTTVASFVPLYAFILDLNKAYARMDKMNEDLIYTATHDHLTGLINRRNMSDYFDKALVNYNLNKKPFSVIIADIDNFKKINDTYGHNNGDVILKSVSNIMMNSVGEKDHVCRWGGEEILVLVDGDLNHAISLAEDIRKSIENTTFMGDDVKMQATITSGVAEYNLNPSIEALINIADDHLYEGKHSTKNCVIA
jgi:diguanylate cyclase (GGDEF)-like protein